MDLQIHKIKYKTGDLSLEQTFWQIINLSILFSMSQF